MQAVSNPFQALNNIFFKPNGVFNALATANNWSWLPFLILMGTSLSSIYIYFNFVNFDWYVETLIQQTMANVSPAEQDIFRNNMHRETALIGGSVMVVIGPVIVNAIIAAYLNAMTKRDHTHTQGFTDWYGITWWTQMPSVINAVIALVILMLATGDELTPTVLGPLSLAFIFSIDMNSGLFNFFSSLRLDYIWTTYLLTVAISQWTAYDTRKSFIIAVAPLVLIYGLWLLFILFG